MPNGCGKRSVYIGSQPGASHEDPFVRLAKAFIVSYPANSARGYRNDLEAWGAWCAVMGVHPFDARRAITSTRGPGCSRNNQVPCIDAQEEFRGHAIQLSSPAVCSALTNPADDPHPYASGFAQAKNLTTSTDGDVAIGAPGVLG